MSIKNTKLRFNDLFVGRIVYAAEPGGYAVKCRVSYRRSYCYANVTLTCSPVHRHGITGLRFDVRDALHRPVIMDNLAKMPRGTRCVYMRYDPMDVPAVQLETVGLPRPQEFVVPEYIMRGGMYPLRLFRTLKQAQRYSNTAQYPQSDHGMFTIADDGDIFIRPYRAPVKIVTASN